MNKKAKSQNPLKPKVPFKWVFMHIIPVTVLKHFIDKTAIFNYLSIVDKYSKTTKLYGTERITTEEVMDKLDIFQPRFRKIDEFGWWDLERNSADASTQFTSTEFQ